ncbi:hypothetical protein [uncultured Gammaproteobacteria bacterium]|nr:hypothetical protein [uncultured Gammaproteobacteria bacterium]CAC9963509.1 hypothetical protein [uncultured Gammaproteobacteria bacterium]CAC9972093.1 hypothetical protein [uncultured Gammaproteobacteria bacterium]
MGNYIEFYNHQRFYETLGYKNEYEIKLRKGEGFLNWVI